MDVRAGELLRAVDAERVVPDDPAAGRKADLVLGVDLQLGGVFVADRQPESAAWLEHAMHFLHPLPRPGEVVFVVLAVVVLVVLVADVERRIGECEVDRAGGDLLHQLQAVALMNLAGFEGRSGRQFELSLGHVGRHPAKSGRREGDG